MKSVMSFEDRGRAFETKFVLDQELAFLIEVKTADLVAHWAAERLGLDEPATAQFVEKTRAHAIDNGSQGGFKQQLLCEFAANKLDISENALERLIMLKAQAARKIILKEHPT